MNPARIEKFARVADALRCPLCGEPMALLGRSLRCGRGHSFDVSAKGYVNLMRRAVRDDYDAGFFEARSRILEAGFYRHVLDALLEALDGAAPAGPVLDAGCGEGYYAKALDLRADVPVIGLDTSRDAIARAARGGNGVCWLVSDVAARSTSASCASSRATACGTRPIPTGGSSSIWSGIWSSSGACAPARPTRWRPIRSTTSCA